MTKFIDANEPWLRLGVFGAVLIIMAIWEILAPRRAVSRDKYRRWTYNLGLVAINTVALRLLLPFTALTASEVAVQNGWGLLQVLGVPNWQAILFTLISLDWLVYAQHVLSHKWQWLWLIHKVHHVDTEIDVTTGSRFHPVEIFLSMVVKAAGVIAIGAPPHAVVLFEIILNGTAMFNHSNARMPLWFDRVLRLFIVTPDMHRVHHSVIRKETDSNFGFNLSLWDRIFHTYIAQPEQGHDGMSIGLNEFRERKYQALWQMLKIPFLRMK